MGECFQTLNLTNAYLFAAALQDEEICRNVLEIALNRKITAVRSHAEHTLFLDSDFKSVRWMLRRSAMTLRCRMISAGIFPDAAGIIRRSWMSHL